MTRTKPYVTGSALSLTVGLGYTLCAIAFAIFPKLSYDFMTSLFHGLDFSTLRSETVGFSLASFLFALIVMMVWAFVVGAAYSLIYSQLTKSGDSKESISTAKFSPSRG